ncbi:probable disease resistance protein At4g27220 [Lactuca sativa]|uniref:probable disease resistance protein At4g27220 n=1 Tax=Lactuca sativa TaxID=4236 RepID=UPI0022AE98D3|nr:probable disease resistance protein At4g27220 [Lactuca sativa]
MQVLSKEYPKMEAANETKRQVVPILMVPINRYLRYLILCTIYMREMVIKMTELNVVKDGVVTSGFYQLNGVEEKMRQNISNNLEVPVQVGGWLGDVEKINAKVENVSRDTGSCFNIKIRYRAGRNAFEINEEIDSVMRRYKEINRADHPIPPGRVDSMKPSTSTPSAEHNDFQSREVTFTKALKALDPNHKSHMIALCGMGGVGKTTMMQRLKKIAEEKKMFKFIVEVVIGEKTDPISIQEAISYYLSVELSEKNKSVRANKLRRGFKAKSDGGKNKFLIVLDDVWQSVDLEDIGLSPFPNQCVDFKVLLTSRDRNVCTMMGVEGNSILHVGLLIDSEEHRLFLQFVETSDHELHKIGEDIVKKCCGLPISIKTMACTLRDKSKDAWKDALFRLEHHDIENVASKVFKTSYENLQDDETKSTFLLCGLFPEDFNIPTEELVRYGWGLKLFKKVYTIREARTRLNTCIERLIHTNLLLESVDVRWVKMHDLVRAFVLGMYSKVEHASIVNHGNTLEWHVDDTDDSYKRLSLTCKSMSEFPRDLKFPNLMILKLIHGDKFLRFPQDFYEGMGKLQVISYNKMKYPLLPSSFQCSTNLRVLHLHECSLRMFDCSCIGNLLNLEMLSFADSGIEWLPSTIGNLKKIRLLDLTNCHGLCIANGVFKKLVKLEELYMRVVRQHRKAVNLTEDNCNEMAERSKDPSALELEVCKNSVQPKNMSFEKLQRFQISVGRYFMEIP